VTETSLVGISEVQATLSRLEGTAPWRVALGHGSFVTMDFGAKRLTGHSPKQTEHGEWHLWVQMAAWRIETSAEFLAGSEDSREAMETAINRLEGKVLQRIKVDSPSLGLDLDFGNLMARVFPTQSVDAEYWMLYAPTGRVLVAGPGTTCKWHRE
jgi:hypothetical protein